MTRIRWENAVFVFGLLLSPLSQAGLLHEAAKSGNLRDLKTMLSQGQAVNQQDEKGNTPLHYAVAEGQVEAAVLLLKQPGIAVDQRNHNNETPLHLAGARGRPFIASRLIEQGAELNAQDNNGRTPTCNAASVGHPEFLKLMISKGAAINAQPVEVDGYMTTNIPPTSDALVCAVSGKQRPIIDLLLEKGVEISSYAVVMAITSKDRELIDLLLSKGGRVDYRMLVYGSERERGISDRDYLLFILDKDRGSRQRATPLLLHALQGGDKTRVVELLDLGINVNGRDLYGNTPLHRMAEYGNVEYVKLLLARGASVKERTERGNTPLHKAIGYEQPETAKLLIDAHSNVNARNEIGNTPLHLAAVRGQEDLVKRMLAKGADKTIKNERGLTAGQLAKESGHVDLARLLGVVIQGTSGSSPDCLQPGFCQPAGASSAAGSVSVPAAKFSSLPVFPSHTRQPWRKNLPATTEIEFRVPPQVENGAVAPVAVVVPKGIRAGDQFNLFVDEELVASIRPTGNQAVTGFSTRVRIPVSTELHAFLARKDGLRHTATVPMKATVAGTIPDQGRNEGEIKVKTRQTQGENEVLVLQSHRMARNAYVRQMLIKMQQGTVEVALTPRVSADPLIGIRTPQSVDGVSVLSYVQ